MAFKNWKFIWNPPQTVTAPVPVSGTDVPVSGTATTAAANTSKAVKLKSKLGQMIATSEYLQQVILSRSKGIGIEVDPDRDPETTRALEVLYGVDEAPRYVTVEMYGRTLDAEMAALTVEMQLDKDSPYEVNPFQVAAATQISKAVEDKLVSTGEFRHQLPLLLRNLKGDQVVFSAMSRELSAYPAAAPTTVAMDKIDDTFWNTRRVIDARATDIGGPLYDYLDNYLDEFASSYASMYKLAGQVSHVEAQIESVLTAYVTQPIDDIVRMVSLFNAMKGMLHVPRMKALVNNLSGFVYVRLMAEAGKLRFFFDRFSQLAIMPLKSMTGTVGRALGSIQAIGRQISWLKDRLSSKTDDFGHAAGALKGMSYSYDCGMPHNAAKPKPLKGMSGLDKAGNAVVALDKNLSKMQNAAGNAFGQAADAAITSLASHVKWGMDTCESKTKLSDEAFKKLAERRKGDTDSQLDLMCSTQALDSLTNLGKAVLSAQTSGTVTAASSPTQTVEAVGRILASKESGTGTTFAIQDGQLTPIPPEIPPAPEAAKEVLQRGGIEVVFV